MNEQSSEKLPETVVQELQQAKTLLEQIGVAPTTENIRAVIAFVQMNTTTIHARQSDPYLPDADNAAKWEKLRPGTAEEIIGLMKSVINQGNGDAKELNRVRIDNEKEGFKLSRLIALGCIPVAIGASLIHAPVGLCVAIVVMGIGGPTAASFFSNWGGKASE